MVSVKLLRCPHFNFSMDCLLQVYAKIGHDGAMTDQNTCLVAKGYTKFFGQDYIDKVPGF